MLGAQHHLCLTSLSPPACEGDATPGHGSTFSTRASADFSLMHTFHSWTTSIYHHQPGRNSSSDM